jgi:glyoxylase-like metal-dependent hydrolase (beta-lactamase superfamily II)
MQTHEDGSLRVMVFENLGPFSNNAYIVADADSKEAVIVDMPTGSAPVVAAARDGGWTVKAILLTHSHGDHWADYDLVTSAIGAPVMAHEAERGVLGNRIHKPVEDGQEIAVGPFVMRAIHTPGHTPGSTCFAVGRFLFSGDTLFPGGPGRTQTPADFQRTVESITTRLHALPDETEVFTGHGGGTTIGDSKREFAVFAAREKLADLCGDVTWAG